MKSEIDFLNDLISDWSNYIERYENERASLKEQIARIEGHIQSHKLTRDVLLDRLHELKGENND